MPVIHTSHNSLCHQVAASDVPRRRDDSAASAATKEEEQAVSHLAAGGWQGPGNLPSRTGTLKNLNLQQPLHLPGNSYLTSPPSIKHTNKNSGLSSENHQFMA